MNKALLTLILTFLWLLTSCQVKETSGSGLISGHTPVSNAFTLNTPTADTLISGDVLSLSLTFPFPVTVNTSGGIPKLTAEIGSAIVDVPYYSGSGSKVLTFKYTILAADDDSDGIKVIELLTNGGTLTFDNNGTITDCNTLITEETLESLLVDNTLPTITSFIQSDLPGFYRLNDRITFMVTFDEIVKVTGSPRIAVTLTTGGTVNATYSSGSGTNTISFSYKITKNDADTDGYALGTSIALNSGTIKDSAGNNAVLDYTSFVADAETESANVQFDGRLPFVTLVTIPTAGVYVAAQILDVTLLFNRAVTISGSPYIELGIGSNTRQATYLSGSGTNTLKFRYTTVPGDLDLDGIEIGSVIIDNSGDIAGTVAPTNSYFDEAANNFITVPSSIGILVSANQPEATTVTKVSDSTSPMWGTSPDNVWIIGQNILITVGFNTTVYVNQALGSPRIPITVGSASKYATYLSGNGQSSIIFSYTIAEGDEDIDGSISIGNIELNGGTITDSSTTNAILTLPESSLTSIYVDGIRPYIDSVSAPANGNYSQTNIASFNFTVNWSEAVKYSAITAAGAYIPLNIGGSTVNAIYSSGNQTNTIIHAPSSLVGKNDNDGIIVVSPFGGTGTVKDQAGNAATTLSFTSPVTTGVLVDSGIPSIVSISTPSAGTYYTGNDLDFTITFSESMTVTTTGGDPYLQIQIGSNTRLATVTSSGTGTSHTFRYTVAANDTDPDFLELASLSITIPGSSSIKDSGSNDLLSTTFDDPSWTGVTVDEVAPSITGSSTMAKTYVSAGDGLEKIVITVGFSETITVDTSGGTPSIALSVATGDVEAIYDEFTSTSNSMNFSYTVDGAVDMDLDGLALVDGSIQLNGATITDSNGNNAETTVGSVSFLSSVFIAPHATVWIKGSTTNRSGFDTKPTITTNASVTSGYFLFDGSSKSLGFSSIGTAYAVYMAIKTPASGDTYPQNLIAAGELTFDNNTIDIYTFNSSDVQITSAYSSSGNSHLNAMTPDTYHELELLYPSGVSLPYLTFIPSSFSGDVAEIIIFETDLSVGQKAHIFDYIDTAHP
jgi:hypothetical protein